MTTVKKLWDSLHDKPAGKWMFTRAVMLKAPYFSSIKARFEDMQVGSAEITLWDKRHMHNHIGTVHAIALCNAAEMLAGVCTDYSIPDDMRWIPKGMTVRYLKPARGKLKVTGSLPVIKSGEKADTVVSVEITDGEGDAVFSAEITMYCTPKRKV